MAQLSRYRAVLQAVIAVLVASIALGQFYYGFHLVAINVELDAPMGDERIRTVVAKPPPASRSRIFHPAIVPLPRNESFGACLMMKEDNNLLYEWLAYHYTVLPLRYVVVGSDLGNTHDPNEVLERWTRAKTDLQYWILNATQFMHRFGERDNVDQEHKDFAHHYFIHRQRGFVTTCTEFFRQKNMSWVTFIDSDEFLVLNRIGPDDEEFIRESDNETSRFRSEYIMRKALPPAESDLTVRVVIENLRRTHGFSDICYAMPRLLFGALETKTCPGAKKVKELAGRAFNLSEMSTLRFVQTAKKGDFASGKYGKVFLDVSRLSTGSIMKEPKNVHRPFQPECPRPVVYFPSSLFYLNHYVGSWERYSSRQDDRRSRAAWEPRAYLQHGVVCDKAVYTWLPRFIKAVGMKRAQYLLGVSATYEEL